MTLRSTLMLAGASLATAFSGVAANATTIYAGGSSLVAPYIRQAADCWGDKLNLAFIDKSATQAIADFNYTGTPVFDCSTTEVSPGNAVSYISTGSGRAFLGFFAHSGYYNSGGVQDLTKDSWLTTLAVAGVNAPPVYATKVDFALSDAGVPQTDSSGGGDIDTYNGTVAGGKNVTQSGQTIGIRDSAGTYTGTADANHTYRNPRANYGAAIQIPVLIAVVDVAFDPVYKKVATAGAPIETSYKNGTASGKVKLTNTQLCNIFTGVDTNMAQDGLAATFGVQTADLPNTASIPVQIVGRSDGSGTTQIFRRHVQAICGTTAYTTTDGSVPTSLPTALRGATYNKGQAISVVPAGEAPGKFTLANGSDGVSEYVNFSRLPNNAASGTTGITTLYQTRIGYVGNDFVLPYVTRNAQNTYGLVSAALQNKAGGTGGAPAYIAATPATAAKAFGATVILPPQTTSAGKFLATAQGNRADPATNATNAAWVSAPNIASPLANPAASGAYPLVGTTNALFYQCYSSATNAAVIKGFLNWYYNNKVVTDTSKGVLALNGLGPVTKPYQIAITETFITNPTYTGTGKLNLDISSVGTAPECTGVTTGA